MPHRIRTLSKLTLVRFFCLFQFLPTEQVRYKVQQKFDTSHKAGNGRMLNGSYIGPPPDPTAAYMPWNASIAHQWLSGLKNKPTIVTIDNEMEITSNTHQDMHPQ